MKVNQIITDNIIKMLEDGTIPWKRTWYKKGCPMNLESRRYYRGLNIFLLNKKQFDYNYYLTFAQVKKAGGQVKKGQRSNVAIFYTLLNIAGGKGNDESKDDVKDDVKERKFPYLKFYHVFNISQTTLSLPDELKEIKQEKISNNYPEAKAWIKSVIKKFDLKLRIEGDQPAYFPFSNTIRVPKIRHFDDVNSYYQTLFHEIGHYLDWHINKKSETEPVINKEKYSFNELIAEIFSCFMMNQFRLEIPELFGYSADYIKGWLSVLKNDNNVIITASGVANKLFEETIKENN